MVTADIDNKYNIFKVFDILLSDGLSVYNFCLKLILIFKSSEDREFFNNQECFYLNEPNCPNICTIYAYCNQPLIYFSIFW
jgi:hypothetical protein